MHKWSEKEKERLLQLRINHTQQETADILSREFNAHFTRDMVKNAEDRLKQDEPVNGYKETVEINQDGTHRSDKLIRMSKQQKKDTTFILNAHGYDPDKWEIIKCENSVWNQHNKKDGTVTLYSSSIRIKPKTVIIDFDRLKELVTQTKPYYVTKDKYIKINGGLLEISFYDSHFGISDYDYYKPTQQKTLKKIKSRHWHEILFCIGSDMFHTDNFRGQTANGTQIQEIDVAKAWEDATKFYEPMIIESLKHSKRVKIIYVKGNHDESMSWAYVQYLKGRFPQIEFDDTFQERKVHTYGNNFIGFTHGDKARKDLHNIFPVEFPIEWSQAKTREVHIGHFHKEDLADKFGTMVRTLATRNKTDKWHKDMGYVGAHKRFMLFEYSEEELEAIYYV